MAANAHALLSPSAASRWLQCTPSARIAAKAGEKFSPAAREGTAAHALAEHKLRRLLKQRSQRPVSDYDTDTMEECTDDYVSFIQEAMEDAGKDAKTYVEQQLDLSSFIPEGFGTADCLVVSDKVLHVIDFKYGTGVLVNAKENPQMKIYALGAIDLLGLLYDFDEVLMTIFQPRRENIDTWKTSKKDLLTWGEKVLKPTAELAFTGSGEFKAGDWCRFCPIATKCRVRARAALKVAEEDFKMPPELTDEEIAKILPLLPHMTNWAENLMAYAADAAISHGKHWPGYKVVAGRTIRRYRDEAAVIKAAEANGYHDIFDKKLISLSQMEKLMGKENFQKILGNQVIKPAGKLTLVPMSDKRPEITTGTEEFTEVKDHE